NTDRLFAKRFFLFFGKKLLPQKKDTEPTKEGHSIGGGCPTCPPYEKSWSGIPSKCEFSARFCNLFLDQKLCCNPWSYGGLVQIYSSGGLAPATRRVCVKRAGAIQRACPGRAVCVW